MAKLPGTFNTENVDDSDDFAPIPAAWYPAEIVKSEMKNSNKHTEQEPRQYLNLQFKIIGDSYANRRVFHMLNLVNPSEQTVEIANKQLKKICTSVGLVSVDDSEELHGKPLEIKVAIEEETDDYPAKNVVKGFRALEGVAQMPTDSKPFSGGGDSSESKPEESGEKKKAVWD